MNKMDIKQEYPVMMTIKSDNDNIDIKSEQTQNNEQFLEDPIKIYNKVEIKGEPFWLETHHDIEDGHFPPVISPRLCSEEPPDHDSGKSSLLSTEVSGKETHVCDENEHATCENQTSIISVEEQVLLEQSTDLYRSKTSYKCNVCGKSFTRRSSLNRHNDIHEGKKPYKCETCDKTFTQLSSLKIHTWIHEGIKPHKCNICHKNFTMLSHLKRHYLIHEGIKPYKCNTCDKRFTQLSNLKTHNMIHDDKRPYKCNICHKTFIHLSQLEIHNLFHEGKKSYKCNVCDEVFTQLGQFKLHYLIHEGRRQV